MTNLSFHGNCISLCIFDFHRIYYTRIMPEIHKCIYELCFDSKSYPRCKHESPYRITDLSNWYRLTSLMPILIKIMALDLISSKRGLSATSDFNYWDNSLKLYPITLAKGRITHPVKGLRNSTAISINIFVQFLLWDIVLCLWQ